MVVKNRKKTYTIVKVIIKSLYDKYLFMMENTRDPTAKPE
jgi:hypothetical protein